MAKTYSSDSLDRFGDDMCKLLLSYLSLEEKFKFECVSKQWQRVVFTTLTILSINHNSGRHLIPKKLLTNTFQSNLVSLKNRIKSTFGLKVKKTEYNWSRVKTILKKCTNISSIDLTEIYQIYRIEDKAIELITKHCSHLTHIDINFDNISVETIDKFFTKFGPQLKIISILRWNPRVDKKCIEKWLEKCVNLHSLNNFHPSIQSQSLQSVTESQVEFKGLNSMHLCPVNQDMTALNAFANKYGHQMKTITIVTIASHLNEPMINCVADCLRSMQTLVKIAIFSNPLSSQQLISLLAQISTNCWRLKSLEVSVEEWTPDLINTISERFTRLKRLDLIIYHMSGEPLTSHSLAPLKRLTHLDLDLVSMYFTDTFFANIGHNLPNLQYLKLYKVNISDESLISLSGLRQIRGISLTGNTNDISENAVKNLNTNCPKILLNGVTLENTAP